MTFTTIELNDSSSDSSSERRKVIKNETKKRGWFYRRVVRPAKKNPLVAACIVLLTLSSLFLLILLGGGNGVYLTRFEFDELITKITKKKSITFTLYGYCVDDKCSDGSMKHDPSTMPKDDEIADENDVGDAPSLKKRLDVGGAIDGAKGAGENAANGAKDAGENTANGAKDAGENVADGAKDAGENVADGAKDAGENVADGAKDAGDTISKGAKEAEQHAEEYGAKVLEAAKDAGEKVLDEIKAAIEVLKKLLKGLADFLPKHPIEDLLGLISIPYLVALISNLIAIFVLCFKFPTIAFPFVALAFIMNGIAFAVDLFIFDAVFSVLAFIPGIGDNHKGPAMHLAGWSLLFLFIAFILTMFKFYYMFCCGGGARLCFKNTRKYTKMGVSKLRERMNKRGQEMQQV